MRSLFVAGFLSATLPLGATELVPGGGMEPPFATGLPPGWQSNCWGKNQATFSPGEPRAGQASLKVECTSFESGAVQFLHPLRVRAGTHYAVSLWLRAAGGVGTVGVGLRHGPAPYTMHLSAEFEVGEAWEQYAFAGTSLNADDRAGLFLWFQPDGSGTLWVDDVSVAETEPKALDLPLPSGNVVPNASFELPLERDWRSRHVRPRFDAEKPFHGTRTLRWDLEGAGDEVASRVVEFGGRGERFTLAFAARAEGEASVVAELWPAVRVTASQPFLRVAAQPKGEWEVFRTTAPLPSSSNGGYALVLRVQPRGKATVWLDALRLDPGDGSSPFRCSRPVEAGLECSRLAHIGDEGQPVPLIVRAFNDADQPASRAFTCRVSDYWRRPVTQKAVKLDLPPRAAASVSLALDVRQTGVFLAELLDGDAVVSGLSFSVLPPPSPVPADRSAVGGHFRLDPFHLQVANRLGVKWTRIHDCEEVTHWNTVEPEKGRFVWHDAKVRLAQQHGVRILGEFLRVPKWASSAGPDVQGHDIHQCPPRDLGEFAAYVHAVVTHYKDAIHHWEVWNEPYGDGFWRGTAEQFAELAKVAARETHAADPAAVVLSPCAYPSSQEWVDRAIAAGALTGADAFSYHGYELFQVRSYGIVRQWAAQGREKPLPLWNTETGPTARTFLRHLPDTYADAYTNWLRSLPCDVATEHAVQLFVLALAGGAERYFHYWCVYEESLLPRLSAMTIFEHDGSLRPMAVAYAVAARLLDGTRGEGWIELPGQGLASLLRDEQRLVAVLWRRGGRRPRQVRLPIAPARLEVRNLMGNRLTPQESQNAVLLSLSGEPLYLIAAPASADPLRTALQKATPRE